MVELAQALAVLAARAGLPGDELEPLAPRLREPAPGTIEPRELTDCLGRDDSLHLALLAAIVAATDFRRFAQLLERLLAYLLPQEQELDAYDCGRLWHLIGFSAWRQDRPMTRILAALNRGLDLLTPLSEQPARAYLGRVWNTLGQLMHYQGRFHEARFAFETALRYRDQAGEPIDRAFTLGNLARVCMDVGDYQPAADYLRQDLAISRALPSTPPHVAGQLLSELGACHLLLGELEPAAACYRESLELAERHQNTTGRVFALIGLGRLALAEKAEQGPGSIYLRQAWDQLDAAPELPASLRDELTALLQELEGDQRQSEGDHPAAIAAYDQARAHFEASASTVPREIGQLLYKLAQSQLAAGHELEGAMTLRSALSRMDATAQDDQRQRIEALFKERFPQLWMLHAAGRFIGQRQIDQFLAQTGQSGFLVGKRQMAVLFCDLRGFTSLSETLDPEALIGLLNDFLTRMTRSIERFDGMVDKFIGDAVMAVFPATDPAQACRDAAFAALLMQAELEFFNRELEPRGMRLEIGIGLHFGPLVSGLIGSPQKRAYTVIGDVVNSASRLEGMTKLLGASILLSGDLAGRLPSDAFLLRPLGRYSPKGRAEALPVYDLMGENDGSLFAAKLQAEIERCQACLTAATAPDPESAIGHLVGLAQSAGHERRSQGYRNIADLIRRQLEQDPGWGWARGLALREK